MFRICEFIWHCSRHRHHRTLTRTTTRFWKNKYAYIIPDTDAQSNRHSRCTLNNIIYGTKNWDWQYYCIMIVCGVLHAHKDLNAQRPYQRRNILRPSGHRVTKSRSMNPCAAPSARRGRERPRPPAPIGTRRRWRHPSRTSTLCHPRSSKHPQCLIVRCATTTGQRFPD